MCAFSVVFRCGTSLIATATTIKTVCIALYAGCFHGSRNALSRTTSDNMSIQHKQKQTHTLAAGPNCLRKYCDGTQFDRIVHAPSLRQVFNQISWNYHGSARLRTLVRRRSECDFASRKTQFFFLWRFIDREARLDLVFAVFDAFETESN